MNKSYWTTNGSDISLAVPFTKVDKQKRIVSGFATLDNVDKHGDIVDTAASLNAFKRFRGNIREMHQPIAVGKVVSFKQQDFYDAQEKKNYSGVYVDVYVSKGAQDTWEKVLDGTLSGFSIGGSINKADTLTDLEKYDEPVRLIRDYDLVELSLVDNPANQLANVFSIQKADIGFTVTGMATEVKAVNVMYCTSDHIAITTKEASAECSACNSTMNNIGWIEEASDTKSADIALVVDAYIEKNTNGEGGKNMENEKPVDELGDNVEAADVESVEAPAEEVVEVPATEEVVEEAPAVAVESEFEKMVDGIKKYVAEEIAKAADTPGVEEIISQMMAGINKSLDEMTARHDGMQKGMSEMASKVDELCKRMDSYESATAIKKSNDLETESLGTVKKTENIWKGHFLGVQNL